MFFYYCPLCHFGPLYYRWVVLEVLCKGLLCTLLCSHYKEQLRLCKSVWRYLLGYVEALGLSGTHPVFEEVLLNISELLRDSIHQLLFGLGPETECVTLI